MPLKSLNQLHALRERLLAVRALWLRATGVSIAPSARVSLSAQLHAGRKGSISIGADSLVAFKTLIYSYDPLVGADRPVRIGQRCFIGGGTILLPGVSIGDGSIVGAGSVVTESVPPGSIVGGNPARVLRCGVEAGRFGRLPGADENTMRMWYSDEER